MCLIFLAYRAHPDFELVVAANRDERHDRPSAPLHRWPSVLPGSGDSGSPSSRDVIAGRDLEAGGTWMGATLDGRFAALTNFRGPARMPEPGRTRGDLVKDFLTRETSAEAYLASVASRASAYAGFNLLVANHEGLGYLSHHGEPRYPLPPGIYGLSNHLLDSPWPKVVRGKARLRAWLATAGPETSTTPLFDLLADRAPAPDEDLPDTGIGLERERELAPSFILGSGYGTRSSTVLRLSYTGRLIIEERSFDPDGQEQGFECFSGQCQMPERRRTA